jgi:hypothetical protein
MLVVKPFSGELLSRSLDQTELEPERTLFRECERDEELLFFVVSFARAVKMRQFWPLDVTVFPETAPTEELKKLVTSSIKSHGLSVFE